MKPLKNYTSDVPVERTIARIESLLAQYGANKILKQYENGEVSALLFTLTYHEKEITIRFPANVQAVYETLKQTIKRPRPTTLKNLRQQAARTAWKLMQDWIEVQISLNKMHQVDILQVFLSYVWDGQATFYERLKSQEFLALKQG